MQLDKSLVKSGVRVGRRHGVTLSMLLAMTAASPSVMAAAVSQNWVSTATFAHPLGSLLGSKDTLASGEAVNVVVALKLRDAAALDRFLAAQKIPGSPAYDQVLTPAQFTAQFAPTEAQAQAVADHLTANGFRNVVIAPNRLLVTASGTAGTVQSAFQTSLGHVQVGSRNAVVNLDNVKVPASLDGVVGSVLGLQTADIFHTTSKRADAVVPASSVSPEAKTQAAHGFNPTVFPTVYHAGTTPTASGTTVAIIAEGSLTNVLADFKSFLSQNGIAAFTPTVEKTGASSTDTSGDGEWDLDSQDIISMAGGTVGKLIFYDGPSLTNSDLTTELNQVVTDNTAKVINVSLGECETSAYSDGSLAADDNIFKQAQAQGQTFAVSTGDSGSNECTTSRTGTIPSSPASSPYVVAVGGTTLTATAANAYSSEAAWTDGGGSPSKYEAQPSWQSGYVPQTAHRGLADVAFDADPNTGAIIIVDGASAQYGGTSLAAPLFTAAWARIETSHSNSLGFAAPLIYAAYGKSKTPFHDVTSGSNGAYTAKAGWDYPTGFGSFDIQLLNAAL